MENMDGRAEKQKEEKGATPKQKTFLNEIFTLTAYCPCYDCCGKTDGITATGTQAKEGRTIAVDPDKIPYGTQVVIGDRTYIAEDCGGAIKGNHIDVFFDTHQEALDFGVQEKEVKIVLKNEREVK